MQEFIKLAVATLGATEQTVRSATAGMLDLIPQVLSLDEATALLQAAAPTA